MQSIPVVSGYASRRRSLLCWAILAIVVQPAFAQNPRADALGSPKIELSATEWDFGERWSGEPAATVLTVRNVGDAPLDIRKVGRDCACLVAKIDKLLLKPSESVDVEITYNTKKPKPEAAQKVWFETNDPTTPTATFSVTGRVRQVFNINIAHELTFGLLARTEAAERSVEIESYYDKPVRLKLEPFASDHFAVRMETLEEGKRFKVTATTKPPQPYGQNNVTAQISTGLEFLPEIPIRISSFVQPPVAVEPGEIIVPTLMARRTLRILRVTSRRDKPITITDVTSSDESVQAELLPESPGQSHQSSTGQELKIRVSLPPASELPEGGVTITISTDDPEFKELIVPVRPKQAAGSRKP